MTPADRVWVGVGLLLIALCALRIVRELSDLAAEADARRRSPSRLDEPPQ